MLKKRLNVDWSNTSEIKDLSPALKRFENYLRNKGFRDSTLEPYIGYVRRYLEFAKTDQPSAMDANEFRMTFIDKRLARSTINNCSLAITHYHNMLGNPVDFPFLKRNDEIPYFFDQDDVLRIFSVCNNIKHLAMLKTLFYASLRAFELCNLDDRDVDLKTLTLHVRQGKGGKDGIVLISNDCASTLRKYLAMRPSLKIDDRQPLFYTDYGRRWDRRDVHRMFVTYKMKAGIEKQGGVHVFARHSSATIMVANGCDIRIVKELLRHNDIRTTLRYAHVSDKTLRERYEKCLVL
ncbi:MAG: tyrosine-type recombinase/integrase [Methanotrichaceae archaeon]|jgi:integrase/recombinase XerD